MDFLSIGKDTLKSMCFLAKGYVNKILSKVKIWKSYN